MDRRECYNIVRKWEIVLREGGWNRNIEAQSQGVVVPALAKEKKKLLCWQCQSPTLLCEATDGTASKGNGVSIFGVYLSCPQPLFRLGCHGNGNGCNPALQQFWPEATTHKRVVLVSKQWFTPWFWALGYGEWSPKPPTRMLLAPISTKIVHCCMLVHVWYISVVSIIFYCSIPIFYNFHILFGNFLYYFWD